MAHKFRSLISNKMIQALDRISVGGKGLKSSTLIPCIQVAQKAGIHPEFRISLRELQRMGAISSTVVERKSLLNCADSLVEKFDTDFTIPGIYVTGIEDKKDVELNFKVNCNRFVEDVISLTLLKPKSFWRCSALINLLPEERIVADFSSPNIAKPFHVGHLRSTILGNFICNLHEAFGHTVTRINYLGDWGTQFGLLKYGFDSSNMTERDLETDALRKLYDVYVYANQKAKEDPSILDIAKETFNKMEQGDEDILKSWKLFRRVSIEALEQTYSRLNVNFDEYHGESMYSASECQAVVKMMEEKGLLKTHQDGRKMFQLNPKQSVTVVKSDGSNLYLTRDIVGAIDRYKRYEFTRSYYVVDNAQTDHFIALFNIINKLGYDWAENMKHITFGRILGMSTRKGTAIFLKDLLDEAQIIMKENQDADTNTPEEVRFSGMEIADKVAVTSILVSDMKRRRRKGYTFSWEKTLQGQVAPGMQLQLSHCKLMTLEEKNIMEVDETVNTRFLKEACAINLICLIARFDEILVDSYKDLEPCVLVDYLMKLRRSINVALQQLEVKSSPPDVAKARLALFITARHTLAAGMKILGIEPLNKL